MSGATCPVEIESQWTAKSNNDYAGISACLIASRSADGASPVSTRGLSTALGVTPPCGLSLRAFARRVALALALNLSSFELLRQFLSCWSLSLWSFSL